MLINLLSNAIKYNRSQGHVRLTIAADSNGQVCLTVADAGIGIAHHRQPELFQYFSRLGADRSAIDGHGIGLAVTYGLVQLMHGHITVISEEGVGSTFTVHLPATLPSPDDVHGSQTEVETSDEPTRSATILNIDDSAPNRRLVKGILASYPQLVLLEATTGESGVALAARHHPDLILMDLQLPGMDGFDALRALRDKPETRDIPVVAVSANVAREQAERIKADGFDGYIAKPFEVVDFLAMVHRLLPKQLGKNAQSMASQTTASDKGKLATQDRGNS